jgi:hypothetical protein
LLTFTGAFIFRKVVEDGSYAFPTGLDEYGNSTNDGFSHYNTDTVASDLCVELYYINYHCDTVASTATTLLFVIGGSIITATTTSFTLEETTKHFIMTEV